MFALSQEGIEWHRRALMEARLVSSPLRWYSRKTTNLSSNARVVTMMASDRTKAKRENH